MTIRTRRATIAIRRPSTRSWPRSKRRGSTGCRISTARFYGASAAEISVVGDFDVAAVKDQLQRLFGAWSAPSRYARVPDPLVTKRAAAMPIETPDKANAFLIGQTAFALSDNDPDYPALMLANYMLGGSTNARLWNRVRQKEGLSYGINSSMHASSWEPNTTISISAIFAPENLERLRSAVQDEVERAQREGFSAEEVADAKRALLQQRRLARSQDATLAAALERAVVCRPHVRLLGQARCRARKSRCRRRSTRRCANT